MSDLEVVLSLLVVWAAWVVLTVADELVHARKVANRRAMKQDGIA
jgi:hypothetical protein